MKTSRANKTTTQVTLILENLRSGHNVGSIFRTADACGISKIILVGTTPCPTDRFGRTVARAQKDIAQSALGAENSIPWEYAQTFSAACKKLPEKSVLIALEQDSRSIDYKKLRHTPAKNYAIVIGNEPDGISKKILDRADFIAEIPMLGKKESLNVSVATGIFLARFMNL